jgi:hypothetical protein
MPSASAIALKSLNHGEHQEEKHVIPGSPAGDIRDLRTQAGLHPTVASRDSGSRCRASVTTSDRCSLFVPVAVNAVDFSIRVHLRPSAVPIAFFEGAT